MIKKAKKSVLAFFILLICVFLAGCRSNDSEHSVKKSEILFDTVVTIELYGTDDETLLDDCFSLGHEYEQLLSKTIDTSEVALINQSGGQPVSVSDETIALLQLSLYYEELTDGAFDVTVAAVTDLWDFSAETPVIPANEQISSALAAVGSQFIIFEENTVTLSNPDTQIDLGGVAKGYIADRMKDFLIEAGIEHALLNLGGDVLTIGSKPNGSAWNIGIQEPFAEQNEVFTAVSVIDKAVVTSGSYERYIEANGTIYHHILDPATGWPVNNELVSVTIIADNAADADCLSTACFVLGLDDGLTLIESLTGVEAMFLCEDSTVYYSSGYPDTSTAQ